MFAWSLATDWDTVTRATSKHTKHNQTKKENKETVSNYLFIILITSSNFLMVIEISSGRSPGRTGGGLGTSGVSFFPCCCSFPPPSFNELTTTPSPPVVDAVPPTMTVLCLSKPWLPRASSFSFFLVTVAVDFFVFPKMEEVELARDDEVLKRTLLAFGFGTFWAAMVSFAFFNFWL